MKILFIGDTYLPVNCGMTSVIKYLAEELHTGGHDVSVVANTGGRKLSHEEKINGILVRRFNLIRNHWNKVTGEVDELRKFVNEHKADVIVFEALGSIPFDGLVSVMSTLPGRKILHSHGNTYKTLKIFCLENGLKYVLSAIKAKVLLGWQQYFVYPRVIRQMDHVVILSHLCSDNQLMSRYARHLSVIGNAVEPMFFENNDENYELPIRHQKYILSIASYYELKNQKLMVSSYRLLKTKGYSLVMIGQSRNGYYDVVRQMADEVMLADDDMDVVMLTGVDRKYFPQILRNASLYLVASRKEEFSISLAEAMSCGLPFVSTDVGNARELPGGIVIGEDSEMSEAMDRLLSDEALRASMSKKAREYAEANFKQEAAVGKLNDIIRELEIPRLTKKF